MMSFSSWRLVSIFTFGCWRRGRKFLDSRIMSGYTLVRPEIRIIRPGYTHGVYVQANHTDYSCLPSGDSSTTSKFSLVLSDAATENGSSSGSCEAIN